MAKYEQYAEYKDSGVEWLGEIPSEWSISSIKYLSTLISTGGTPKNQISFTDEQEINWFTPSDFSGDFEIRTSAKYVTFDSVRCGESKLYPSNAILMIGIGATLGKIAICKTDFSCNQQINIIVPNKSVTLEFLAYSLIAQLEQIKQSSNSSTIGIINQDKTKQLVISLPTFIEQNQIIKYLDHETAQIDTLISKQEKLIELLKEKRQSVISHAVTKGLNPNVTMKESGVEWLGQVPEHWDVIQAKYIADITRGAILRPVDAPEYFDENGEWAYLNISDATKCDKYLYESKLRLSHLGSTKSARVYPDNLIITASATIGKAFINKIKVCVHDGFIPFCNIKVDINYLYHYVSNPYLYAAMGKSNTQKNIYLDEVKNMIVTVPPRLEQEQIVEYIENNQSEYDELISKADKAIQLMKERRTALISSAVTGKIDVRNWQNPNHNNNEANTELGA